MISLRCCAIALCLLGAAASPAAAACTPPTPPDREGLPKHPSEPKRPPCGDVCDNKVISQFNDQVAAYNASTRTYMAAANGYAQSLNSYLAAAEAYAKCEIAALQAPPPDQRTDR